MWGPLGHRPASEPHWTCQSRYPLLILKWRWLSNRATTANPASQRYDIIERNAVWSSHETGSHPGPGVCAACCFPSNVKNLLQHSVPWGASEHGLGTEPHMLIVYSQLPLPTDALLKIYTNELQSNSLSSTIKFLFKYKGSNVLASFWFLHKCLSKPKKEVSKLFL